MFISVPFIVVFFSSRSENFSITRLFSDVLLSSNRVNRIVELNFCARLLRSAVLFTFSVIKIGNFCMLSLCSRIPSYFPRDFTSVLFTSRYRCITFCILGFFKKNFVSGIIEFGDPVSIINSFSRPFTSANVVKYLLLSVILFIFSIQQMQGTDLSDSSPIAVVSSSDFFGILFS